MTRNRVSGTALLLLTLLALPSCRTMGGDYGANGGLVLPRLRQGAAAPAPNAELTGTLERDGNCLRIGGNGNTVVIWPRTPNARSSPGGGNVIIVWPYTTTLEQRRADGGGTIIIVWARAVGTGTPVRLGERVALVGDMKDDMSGLALAGPLPRGCAGRAFVVRDFRPAGAAEAE
jgi:hypothetical protein